MEVYKLTDRFGRTYNETQWGEGVTHKATGKGELCSDGWLHFYFSAEMGIMMNPCHAGFDEESLLVWKAEASGHFRDDNGLKGGCTELRTVQRIEKPVITWEHRLAFGVLSAALVSNRETFDEWARDWLTRKDRSRERAKALYFSDQCHSAGDCATWAVWNKRSPEGANAAAAAANNASHRPGPRNRIRFDKVLATVLSGQYPEYDKIKELFIESV